MKQKVTNIFKMYFKGELSRENYRKMYEPLSKLEHIANIDEKSLDNDLDNDNETLRDFVEKFYDLKCGLKENYRRSIERDKTLEEQIKPLKDRLFNKMFRRGIVKLYSKCNKFELVMLDRLNIYMPGIYRRIQEEKSNNSANEL